MPVSKMTGNTKIEIVKLLSERMGSYLLFEGKWQDGEDGDFRLVAKNDAISLREADGRSVLMYVGRSVFNDLLRDRLIYQDGQGIFRLTINK